MQKKIFYLISLGCPRNLVDSEVMAGILIQSGFESSTKLSTADFIIINTCSFLQSSRAESFKTIKEIFLHKKKSAKVIVAGCMVRMEREALLEQFPDIHYLIGSGDVSQIALAMKSDDKGEIITQSKSFLETKETPRILSTPRHTAYLKIAEGCQKRCSYCIIPIIKGPLRSKKMDDVVREFTHLLDKGAKEVVLIAQDLGDYGKDRNEKGALTRLISELLLDPRDFWLRLLYLYPDEIDDALISLLSSDPRICPYLDMPIQHINDEILKAMRRSTTQKQILSLIERLRKALPNISIRTSLIVGFPGETEEQFQELLNFVKTAELDHVGFFPFSLEEKSLAAELPNRVDEKTIQKRLKKISKTQQEVVTKKNQSMIGKTIVVQIDGLHPESSDLVAARHSGQCFDVDPIVIINDAPPTIKKGERYSAQISSFAGYDLVGKIEEKS